MFIPFWSARDWHNWFSIASLYTLFKKEKRGENKYFLNFSLMIFRWFSDFQSRIFSAQSLASFCISLLNFRSHFAHTLCTLFRIFHLFYILTFAFNFCFHTSISYLSIKFWLFWFVYACFWYFIFIFLKNSILYLLIEWTLAHIGFIFLNCVYTLSGLFQ